MRILIVAPSLGLGGAECVAARMANHWAARGRDVAVALFEGEDAPRHYPLTPSITLDCLDIYDTPPSLAGRLAALVRRHLRIRRCLRRHAPDVVVCITDSANIRVLLAARGLGLPVVCTEHTDPTVHDIGPRWRLLRRLTYRRCNTLVVLSDTARDYCAAFMDPERIRVFPNPMDFPAPPHPEARQPVVIYVGRLVEEKGVDALVRAFARSAPEDWRLRLVGDGPLRSAVEALADELGVAGRVECTGRVADPYPLLAQAGVFVLPSRYEGLPNALVEAMGMGLACIATATSGARQVLRHEDNGLLVPVGDESALADALARLTTDADLRRRLGDSALNIRHHAGTDSVMARWDTLLESLEPGR